MRLTLINASELRKEIKDQCRFIATLIDEDIGQLPGTVNLICCDDERIQELNRMYRGKDQVTDVLSFTWYEGFTKPQDLVGEVYINLAQTRRQAKERRRSFEIELYTLCIHGLAHLRGYDHEEDDEFRVMKLIEDRIMKRLLDTKKT